MTKKVKKIKSKKRTDAGRISDVLAAYNWENQQIAAWQNNMLNNPAPPAGNKMATFFKNVWDSYFSEVTTSNNKIMAICASGGSPSAIWKQIDAVEHIKASVQAVRKAAHDVNDGSSVYLDQLEKLMHLEADVRDAVEDYLEHSIDPPPPPFP